MMMKLKGKIGTGYLMKLKKLMKACTEVSSLNFIYFSYLELKFINEENMNINNRVYGTNNVAHCFSRAMTFPQWMS